MLTTVKTNRGLLVEVKFDCYRPEDWEVISIGNRAVKRRENVDWLMKQLDEDAVTEKCMEAGEYSCPSLRPLMAWPIPLSGRTGFPPEDGWDSFFMIIFSLPAIRIFWQTGLSPG